LTRGKEGKEERGEGGFSFLSFPSFLFLQSALSAFDTGRRNDNPLTPFGKGDYFLKHAELYLFYHSTIKLLRKIFSFGGIFSIFLRSLNIEKTVDKSTDF